MPTHPAPPTDREALAAIAGLRLGPGVDWQALASIAISIARTQIEYAPIEWTPWPETGHAVQAANELRRAATRAALAQHLAECEHLPAWQEATDTD